MDEKGRNTILHRGFAESINKHTEDNKAINQLIIAHCLKMMKLHM